MAQASVLKCRGLHTFANNLGEMPEGALVQADNVVVDREGVIEPRRGLDVYGDASPMGGSSTSTDRAKQLLSYKGRILRHYGSTLQFDSNVPGTFTSFTGSFTEVSDGLRIKGVEANGNFFVTTSTGIKKIAATTADSISASSVSGAGGVKALDIALAVSGPTAGGRWLPAGRTVAFRALWGIKDVNNNLILGSPSSVAVITAPELTGAISSNTVASPTVVTSTAHGLANNDTVTITGSNSTPSINGSHTVSNVTANTFTVPVAVTVAGTTGTFTQTTTRSVTVTLAVPEGITTNHLFQIYRTAYTSSSGNTDPGDDHNLVYEANPSVITGTFDVVDIQPDSLREGGALLYTNRNSGEGILQANDPPPVAKDIALFRNSTFYANTRKRHSLSITLIGTGDLVSNTSTFVLGNTYTFRNAAGGGEDTATRKVLLATAGSSSQNIEDTARSLVRVINRDATGSVYAYYLSSGATDLPGKILLEARTLGTTAFTVTANSTATGGMFSPTVPTSGTTVSSDNEVALNRIYWSKTSQPEAVPIVNFADVGAKDKAILRVMALRDSLFILKQDGIFRLTGDSPFNFSVALFDSSALLTAPDTASILNNQIYMLSTQGVASISDTGVSVISRPIENELVSVSGGANYTTASFSVPYESDRSWLLWTITRTSDTVATQCFRFNTFTQTWTRWDLAKKCGVVNSDDKLYLGPDDVPYIEQERKSFTRLDYADRSYDATFTVANGFSGSDITYLDPDNIPFDEGDALVQTQYLTVSQFNRLLRKLDSDSLVNDSNYYSTLSATTGVNLFESLQALSVKLDADSGLLNTDGSTTWSYVTIANAGSMTPTFAELQVKFNNVVNKLNLDTGAFYTTYRQSTGTVVWETTVDAISGLNVTLQYAVPFIRGSAIGFTRVATEVVWAPQHFGDPSLTKHVRESTILFQTQAFTKATVSYSSDLSVSYEPTAFDGEGTGTWGGSSWGRSVWGGEGTSRPTRTYIPREKQRCRFINTKFEHGVALEKFAIYGVSYTFEPVSSRGYR